MNAAGFAAGLFAMTSPAISIGQIQGIVIGVLDGDTITVLHDGKGERIRLSGIYCPDE